MLAILCAIIPETAASAAEVHVLLTALTSTNWNNERARGACSVHIMQRDLLALFFSRFAAIHILPSAILDTVSALDRFVHGMEPWNGNASGNVVS